jgi:hypothetical protein
MRSITSTTTLPLEESAAAGGEVTRVLKRDSKSIAAVNAAKARRGEALSLEGATVFKGHPSDGARLMFAPSEASLLSKFSYPRSMYWMS